MAVRIFISSVSDEFREYRDRLRSSLTRHDVEVKVQEDFKDYGGVTLEKLDLYIRACDAVVHLVGDMTGADARGESTESILAKYPDLTDRLPPLAQCFADGTGITYTQWEAWLALYHKKKLLITKPHDTAVRGPRYAPTEASRAAQDMHLKRLSEVERYPGCTFTNPDNLATQIAYGAILDLLVRQGSMNSAAPIRSSGWAEFIRSTYEGVPLKLPDQRFQPLCVFAAHQGRARYLGTLGELAMSEGWAAPRISDGHLRHACGMSHRLGWDAAIDLIGPFLSSALNVDISPVRAGLKGAEPISDGIRIRLGRTRRALVSPFALARSIGSRTHQIPPVLIGTASQDGQALYVADSVLSTQELTLDFDGGDAQNAAAKLEAELLGQISAESWSRTLSSIVVTGVQQVPFAFTCFKVETDHAGYITVIKIGDPDLRLNAAPVGVLAAPKHAEIGEAHDLIAFGE